MNSDAEQEEKIWQRLRRLIIFRIVVVSIFMVVTVFWGTLKPVISLLSEHLFLIYAIIIIMYLLSCGYYILLRSKKYIGFNIYLQLIVDIGPCIISRSSDGWHCQQLFPALYPDHRLFYDICRSAGRPDYCVHFQFNIYNYSGA